MKLAWEPKVSLGNVISAVALILVGFTSYATFQSRFDGMAVKQDALTVQVTAQSVKIDNVSGDVREIKATIPSMQQQIRDLADRMRDYEKSRKQ